MPKIVCVCGGVINLSPIPCPDGFFVRAEAQFGTFAAAVVRLRHENLTDSDFEWRLLRCFSPNGGPAPHIYACPNCHRLAVCPNASARSISWYVPEDQSNAATFLGERATPEE